MKGPGIRLDLDVRRVWRCATCNTERRTPGSVSVVFCHFCQTHPLMTLVEPRRTYRGPAEPLDLVIELHPDDVDAPAFVPAHLHETEASTAIDQAIVTDEPTVTAERTVPDEPAPAASPTEEASSSSGVELHEVIMTPTGLPEADPSPATEAEQHLDEDALEESKESDDGDTTAPAQPHRKRSRRKKRRRKRRGSSSSSNGSSGTPSQNS